MGYETEIVMKYEKLVSKAAKWLDGVEPGWYKRIDQLKLNLRDCTACILGQMYGEYNIGEKILFEPSRLGSNLIPICTKNAQYEPAFNGGPYGLKTALWNKEINSRLEADIRLERPRYDADAFIERTHEIINQPVQMEEAAR